jgi:hypothetical protein
VAPVTAARGLSGLERIGLAVLLGLAILLMLLGWAQPVA